MIVRGLGLLQSVSPGICFGIRDLDRWPTVVDGRWRKYGSGFRWRTG